MFFLEEMLNVIKWLFKMLNAKIFRMLDVNAHSIYISLTFVAEFDFKLRR